MDDERLTSRAYAAYFRSGASIQPNASASGVQTVRRLTYVVLRTPPTILAVYRVRTTGALKRLDRWPKELEENLI